MSLKVNFSSRQVSVDDREVFLTASEYKILEALVKTSMVAVSRHDLISALGWKGESFDTRTVDAHVYRLRKKLGEGFIIAVPGFGYRSGYDVDRMVIAEPAKQSNSLACPACGVYIQAEIALRR